MTTMVIVSSPKPNHQRVRVRQTSLGGETVYNDVLLDDGESTVQYVHGGSHLVIDEVPKDAPVT